MFQYISQRGVVSVLLLLAATVNQPAALAAAQSPQFIDPAPPQVQVLADVPRPTARPHDGLTFYAPPKPLAPGAVTHDWRSFLGPSHNAISTETPLLKRFGDNGPTMLWQVTKGLGFASAAVVGQRVLMFHRRGNEEIIECLEAETGQRFWKYSYPTSYRDRYNIGDGPRCQPVSDGEYVYTFGVEGKLLCLKLTTGQLLWQRDILREFKLTQNHFGVVATPLLEGDLLIVNVGAPAGPCVAAFDKRTGKMRWGAGDQWGPSYASPIPATVNGQRRIFVFAGGESRPPTGGLLSINPANGQIDFRFPWRAPKFESANASSPLIVGNDIFISECYGPGGAVLKMLTDGSARKVWSHKLLNTHFMTPIHKDGYLYGIAGHGPQNAPLVCLDLRTGKQMWRIEPQWDVIVKTPQGSRKFKRAPSMASLIQVDGRCLILGEFGHLAWLDLNPKEYRELERVQLFVARKTWSMPALSRGLLYVCQNTKAADGSLPRLICYDLRGE